MRYATTSDLPSFYSNEQRAILSESIIYKSRKDTFLSHSSKDKDKVAGVLKLLEKWGYHTYVDIDDPGLDNISGKDAAQKLRNKIKEFPRFIVLLSENTNTSKWIPWELGLADEIRGNENIFLFPVKSHSYDTIEGQEYFQLYNKFAIDNSGDWKIFSN